MKKRSKRYKKILDTNKEKPNLPKDIVPLLKKNCTSKFNESIDASFRINTKQGKSETSLRTVVNLPHGSGKKIKVAVVCEENKIDEAKKSGADFFGSESFIEEISDGKINFDKLISTPGMMIKVSKLGKILGPKGLMPNPKLGTVTNDLTSSVKSLKSGQIEIKNDKDGNIGVTIGRKNFTNEQILENFNTVLEVILKEKPTNTKGNFLKSAFLTSTMGISYKAKTKNVI